MTRASRMAYGASAVAVLGGGAVCGLGLGIDREAVLRGWLAGWAFWIGFPVGALMLLLAHDLTGGRWGDVAKAPLKALATTLPVAALAFVPVLLSLPDLYPWARPEEAAKLPNTFYLNTPFFLARAAACFAAWAFLAVLAGRGTSFAAPGLIVMGVTATFASFDWLMSIEPDWGSSIYGMLVISGFLLTALAAAALAASAAPSVGESPRRDLGSLLIAAILLWAYLSFMQFLIVWEADLPTEITWYLKRLEGGWEWTALAVFLAQGLVPFLALLWPPVKRSRRGLAAVCVLLLAAHLLESWWLVLPGFDATGMTWFAPAATLAIGGLSAALFLWRLDAGVRHG
ncbi:hypothetical protein JL100_015690 [Skermanella mucosa]|uniref:hypothetical protein n=1 Tax=Skermanella mucosa TaxID=1789672 RepID=UPI00192CC123|nr:hypothetical protein [Skermanella mucosa]UEM18559.1 hypothetical protein JL100_015690 [Skermanella mucosa]